MQAPKQPALLGWELKPCSSPNTGNMVASLQPCPQSTEQCPLHLHGCTLFHTPSYWAGLLQPLGHQSQGATICKHRVQEPLLLLAL